MQIVVTTPTGKVGSRVTRLLVQAGVRPRVLLRDPARLDPALAPYVETAVVDQRDGHAVVAATAGADALFWVDPSTGEPDPVQAWAHLGEVAARAVAEGIGRTVFLSSVGAEGRHGFGEIDGLARTEEALDATGADVVHLRSGYFFSNLLLEPGALETGVLTTTLPVDLRMPWVDPRDVGDVAAALLLAPPGGPPRAQAVHGPADLSFADAAAIVSRATGRPFRAQQITDDELRRGLRSVGLGERQVEGVVGMAAGLRGGFVPADARTAVTTTPTTLAAWAHDHLGGGRDDPGG